MGTFTITATNLEWIGGAEDDPQDQCLHGHAIAMVGSRKLEYDATVSSTALYLLKTLTEDHIIYEDNQMLPCCGHFCIPNDTLDNVDIIGCVNGIDWTVTHDGDLVIIELDDGTKETVNIEDYKKEVFKFADMIEDFYNSCTPKELPGTDDLEYRNGWIAFWNEWHRRRGDRTNYPETALGYDGPQA